MNAETLTAADLDDTGSDVGGFGAEVDKAADEYLWHRLGDGVAARANKQKLSRR